MTIMSFSKGSLSHRTYPESEQFKNLPDPTELPESIFLVRKSQFFHRFGIYRSNGKKWKRVSKTPVTRAELERLGNEISALKLRVEKLELR